jgi:hypothetical protein
VDAVGWPVVGHVQEGGLLTGIGHGAIGIPSPAAGSAVYQDDWMSRGGWCIEG